MRLYTAQDFEHASASTQRRLLDLVAYISPENVSTKLLYLWLSPEQKYSPMQISVRMNRPSGLAYVPRGKDAENSSTELSVTVRSFLPRMLQSSGDYFYEWTILRSYEDLKIFFDTLQPHCSSCLPKGMLPEQKTTTEVFALHKIVKCLNSAFVALCEDPLWPPLCDQAMVKKFLNIHENDCCHDAQTNKVSRILDPLVAVGLLHIEHRSSETFQRGDDTEEQEQPQQQQEEAVKHRVESVPPDDLLVGVNSSIQDTLGYLLGQENRAKSVSEQVLTFLFDCFKAASGREEGHQPLTRRGVGGDVEGAGKAQPGEEHDERDSDSLSLTRQYLLPHVLKAINMPHVIAEMCINLCQLAFSFSKKEGLFNSAELLARRTLQLLKETNGTPGSTFLHISGKDLVMQRQMEFKAVAIWQHHVAFCIFKQDRHSESVMQYAQALKARQAVSTASECDLYLAEIERELADNSQFLHAYDSAKLHYEASLQIYKAFEKTNQKKSAEIQKHIAHIFENLTKLNYHEGNFSLALEYNNKVYESMQAETPSLTTAMTPLGVEDRREQALFCVHRKARILVSLGHFEAAKVEFLTTLKESDVIYSHQILADGSINKHFRFSFSQLRNKVTVLCNLSECCKGLAQYAEAKQALLDAEVLFEQYAAYHNESTNSTELFKFKQNSKATSKLKISVYECVIDLSFELYELESAVPYTEKAQAVCIDLYGANHHKTSLMSCKAGNLLKSLGRYRTHLTHTWQTHTILFIY